MAADRLPTAVQDVLETPAGEDVVVPEVTPIEVRTRDEVANVAAALNTVQTSALDLAVEQAALRKNIADSFVNLGRRNQNLLDRQLEFITDLERQEQEPERLEGLFRLDHLATRMRRNAESLLRLAGGGDTTQSGWGGPVPIVDVVRGALGEVEGYDRVDVRTLEPAVLNATAGADLAHALAELVENALAFSPPDERVQVRGRQSNGGYVLAVMDQGVGMSPEQLEAANRRLAGRESFTVAPSRYLGHYVAGHLASSLGVTIRLEQEPTSGITARIEIPSGLLVGSGFGAEQAGRDDPFATPDDDSMSTLLTD
jgi:K+-sensing histidine kinase KdpD